MSGFILILFLLLLVCFHPDIAGVQLIVLVIFSSIRTFHSRCGFQPDPDLHSHYDLQLDSEGASSLFC